MPADCQRISKRGGGGLLINCSRLGPCLLLFLKGRSSTIGSSSRRPISANQSSVVAPLTRGGFLSFFAFERFSSLFSSHPGIRKACQKSGWSLGWSESGLIPSSYLCPPETTILIYRWRYMSRQLSYATNTHTGHWDSSPNNVGKPPKWNWFGGVYVLANSWWPL